MKTMTIQHMHQVLGVGGPPRKCTKDILTSGPGKEASYILTFWRCGKLGQKVHKSMGFGRGGWLGLAQGLGIILLGEEIVH